MARRMGGARYGRCAEPMGSYVDEEGSLRAPRP